MRLYRCYILFLRVALWRYLFLVYEKLWVLKREVSLKVIVIVTHSDVSVDSRILKHLAVASELTQSKAIGISKMKMATDRFILHKLRFRVLSARFEFLRLKQFASSMHALILLELNIRMLFSIIGERPKVIVCNDWYVLPAASIGKRILGARLLYDAHELESETTGLSDLKRRLILWIESKTWNHIDSFVTVSQSIQDWYFSRFGEKHGAVVLNSPVVEPESDESTSFGLRAKLGISESDFVFIYVGIIGQGRGVSRLIEIFSKQETGAALVFLGWGEPDWQQKVENACTEYSNIHHLPRVPHSQVVNFIREADAGLCLLEDASLSDRYALPNKLLEYAFAGLPVVSSNLPEIRRIVTDYGLGVCIDDDQNDLAEWISLIRECQSLEGHKRDLKELSWESQAEKIHCVLSSLL